MKHKFKIISIVTILCCIICVYVTGCKIHYWTINHPVEDITQILVIKESEEGYDVFEIDKQFHEECVNDILKLEAHRYFPSPTYPKGNVFKIVFSNGEYDLVAEWEPQHWVLNDKGGVECNIISWLYFNEEQFNQLIEKWANYSN